MYLNSSLLQTINLRRKKWQKKRWNGIKFISYMYFCIIQVLPHNLQVMSRKAYSICGFHIICDEIYIWANLSKRIYACVLTKFIQSRAAMMRMLRERLQGVLCVHDVWMTALYWCTKLKIKYPVICWLKLRYIYPNSRVKFLFAFCSTYI